MTIYIHFVAPQSAKKIHNVESVTTAGVRAVAVRTTFGDGVQRFENVRNVAIEPDTDDE